MSNKVDRSGDDEGSRLRQVSLARIKEFGISPKRDLGQNFLIDDNILGVILRKLDARSDDVVLEVGAGLGVLTTALAKVASHVHAYEVDGSLRDPLEATLGDESPATLHFEDILRAELEKLEPTPTLCASNLPYSVAGPFMIESLLRLPRVRRYVVMVQKEVGERMLAAPGSKTYGTLSVWVGLYARVMGTRALSRSIFYPQPHVDSSLIVLERRPSEELPDVEASRLKAVVQAAFGQRRKTLVNCLSSGLGLPREKALREITQLGLPVDIRAERLQPREFVELARGALL